MFRFGSIARPHCTKYRHLENTYAWVLEDEFIKTFKKKEKLLLLIMKFNEWKKIN